MMFVFGALIEYAFINAMSRKDKKKATAEENGDNNSKGESQEEVGR